MTGTATKEETLSFFRYPISIFFSPISDEIRGFFSLMQRFIRPPSEGMILPDSSVEHLKLRMLPALIKRVTESANIIFFAAMRSSFISSSGLNIDSR